MKQGKGPIGPLTGPCDYCHKDITPGPDGIAYWAWEDVEFWRSEPRRHYHRACARKVQKQRESERKVGVR